MIDALILLDQIVTTFAFGWILLHLAHLAIWGQD